jgi:hypothetical protein
MGELITQSATLSATNQLQREMFIQGPEAKARSKNYTQNSHWACERLIVSRLCHITSSLPYCVPCSTSILCVSVLKCISFDSFLSLSSLACVEMIVERGMRIVQRINQSVLPVFSSFPVDLQHQGHEHKVKTTCRKLLLGFAHSLTACTRTSTSCHDQNFLKLRVLFLKLRVHHIRFPSGTTNRRYNIRQGFVEQYGAEL